MPAESRSHKVRLWGRPTNSGPLYVHGCKVRIFGGVIEELIYPIRKALENPKRPKTKDGKRKKQSEKERLGFAKKETKSTTRDRNSMKDSKYTEFI